MARGDRLKVLYKAHEHLYEGRRVLLGVGASGEIRRVARAVALLLETLQAQIEAEEARLEQLEADEAEGRAQREQEEGQ